MKTYRVGWRALGYSDGWVGSVVVGTSVAGAAYPGACFVVVSSASGLVAVGRCGFLEDSDPSAGPGDAG